MAYGYVAEVKENNAKAVGLALPISRKESMMVCEALRGMNVQRAKAYLVDVMALKKPVAYTRYNMDVGHKRGMAAGRFPASACKHILGVLKNAEPNAQFKGLSAGNLIVKSAVSQKGPKAYHFGRQRTTAKRAHIEIVLEEGKKK